MPRVSLSGLLALALFGLAGCGMKLPAAQQPTPTLPGSGTKTTAGGGDAWDLPQRGASARNVAPKPAGDVPLDAWKRALKAKGVAAAPASCAAWTKRSPSPAKPLGETILEKDADKRDAMLAELEAKAAATERAYHRALRADLAPVECADALTDPMLTPLAKVSGQHEHALLGLSIAAKLARTGQSPPQLGAIKEKAKVKEFIQGPLKAWMLEQAAAIEQLSLVGRDLSGYGRGVAAVEAGTAELRLVDNIRSSPTPKEWDAEPKQIYEASLDEALEPRKARGRDAALVGLGELAGVGARRDSRVDRARSILSKLYGGRRIDALDQLLVPPAVTSEDDGVRSSYWRATGGKDVKPTLAASFELGRLYWSRPDFVEAGWLAKEKAKPTPEERLVHALSAALAHGPANAADMMKAASPQELGLSQTGALDAIASEGGPLAAHAAFDAAHLRALSPPDGPAAGPYLKDVAARFKKAEALFRAEASEASKANEKRAADRAADADAAAAAVK